MPRFGAKSNGKLATCCAELQKIAREAIKIYDFSVLSGYRGEEEQNRLYHNDLSNAKYPDSMHNVSPSQAIDIAPYPIDWEDIRRFDILAGIFKAIAHRHGYNLRWGGDWDGDNDLKDQKFNDLGHFEIIEKENE